MKPLATPVIEVNNFGKNYGGFAAVRDLSFAMRPGEIVGLVGANGAGKTTTLRAISGILRPTTGTVRIGGRDIEKEPVAAKQQFAYIPDTIHPYDLLTVTEHLHFIALAYRVENAEAKYDALLDELELADKKHEPASNLSRGMLQKLSLACAFLREPSVILLDEPLTGLDPRGIRNIKESIRRRAAAGTAFLLSSHLLLLVEALCDQVMILHRGQKMASGSLAEIRNLASLQADASLEDVFLRGDGRGRKPQPRFVLGSLNRALNYLWFSLLKRQTIHFAAACGGQPHHRLCGAAQFSRLFVPLPSPRSVRPIGSARAFDWRHARHARGITCSRAYCNAGWSLSRLTWNSCSRVHLRNGRSFCTGCCQLFFRAPPRAVFLTLFASHLKHPLFTATCVILFQIACFHIATGAAILAGTIPELLYHRLRWMMLGVYFL